MGGQRNEMQSRKYWFSSCQPTRSRLSREQGGKRKALRAYVGTSKNCKESVSAVLCLNTGFRNNYQ